MSGVLFDSASVETRAGAQLVDETVERYVAWREECATVRAGYEHWSSASGAKRTIWFAAYNAALDREECAAELYAASLGRLRRFVWPDSNRNPDVCPDDADRRFGGGRRGVSWAIGHRS